MTLLKLEFVSLISRKVAAELGLNRNQLLILIALGEAGENGLHQKNLVPIFESSKGPRSYSVSMISQALRRAPGKLFAQELTKNDARAKILKLTAAGKKIYQKATQLLTREEKTLGDKIGGKKVKTLISIAAETSRAMGRP